MEKYFFFFCYFKYRFLYELFYKFIIKSKIYAYKKNLIEFYFLDFIWMFFIFNLTNNVLYYDKVLKLCLINLYRFGNIKIKKIQILKFDYKKFAFLIFPNYFISSFLLFIFNFVKIFYLFINYLFNIEKRKIKFLLKNIIIKFYFLNINKYILNLLYFKIIFLKFYFFKLIISYKKNFNLIKNNFYYKNYILNFYKKFYCYFSFIFKSFSFKLIINFKKINYYYSLIQKNEVFYNYKLLVVSKYYYFFLKIINCIYFFANFFLDNIHLVNLTNPNFISLYNYSFIYLYINNFYNNIYIKNNYLLWILYNDKKRYISFFFIFFTHLLFYTEKIDLWCIYYRINIIYFKKIFFFIINNDLLLNFWLLERKSRASFFKKLRFLLKYLSNLRDYNKFILLSKDKYLFSIINIFYFYFKKLLLFIHINYLKLDRTSKGLYI